MNQIASRSPVELFLDEVLPADRVDDLRRSLPGHIKPELLQRNLLNCLMNNPELMEFSPGLIFREVSKAAALGLLLDRDLGEAYLMVGYNGKTKREEPQLRIGYRGYVKLARQSGQISMIYAHEVCENDLFDVDMGANKNLIHKPKVFSDRGVIVGYYAVVKYTNGDFDFEPMSVPDVHRIRDRSDGWKAFKAGRIKTTPWFTDETEMSKKTVIRRLTKRVPLSAELAEAIKVEDMADFRSLGETRLAPPPSSFAMLEGPPADHAPAEPHREDRPARRVAPPPPPPQESRPVAPPPPEPTEAMRDRAEAAFSAPKAHVTDLLPPIDEPPPIEDDGRYGSAAPAARVPPVDPEALRAEYFEALTAARTFEDVDEVYGDYIAPHEDDLFPPDLDMFKTMAARRKESIQRGR